MNITPLRQMKVESTEQAAAVFPVKDAPAFYVERHPLGGRKKGFQGDGVFYGGQSAVRGGVHGVHEEKIKYQERKCRGRSGEGPRPEKSDAGPIHDDELRHVESSPA